MFRNVTMLGSLKAQDGRYVVQTMVGFSKFPRIAGVVSALWLCVTGSAWAGGGGGADAAGLQMAFLNPLCNFLGIISSSCPQFPTINQIILELAALQNTPPSFVRGQQIGGTQGAVVGTCTVAGNFGFSPCDSVAVNAVNPPLVSANAQQNQNAQGNQPAPSSLLSLSPLAFKVSQGQAIPVPAGSSGITSLFYAVATGAKEQPDKLNLSYDYPGLSNSTFTKGQMVAEISLPLQVLNANGSERLICGPQAPGSSTASCAVSLAVLQVTAVCSGGPACLSAVVIGDFSVQGTIDKQSPTAASLGLQFQLSFGPSPNFPSHHAIFNVNVPLIVTGPTPATAASCGNEIISGTPVIPDPCGNDPAYFGVTPVGTNGIPTGTPTYVNQASGLPTAFTTNPNGVRVGIAPSAAPETVGNGTTATFGYCASFLANGTTGVHPAVAAFLTVGTDGTAYASAPVPPITGVQLQCPF
jgi:hypothetical protein